MSRNAKFLQFGEPIRSYKKTVPFAIAGSRLHPAALTPMSFVLTSEEPNTGVEDGVIELYSEDELRHFRRANVRLFQLGYIEEYSEEAPPDPESDPNFLTEERLAEIISTKNHMSFKKKIKDITSIATIQRIWDAIEEQGTTSVTIRAAIEEKMKELK